MTEEITESEQSFSEDVSFSEAAPVKGQGRMDAAWGSQDGDDSGTAQVSSNTASVGYVFEQIYKPWNGSLNPSMDEKLGDITPSCFRHFPQGSPALGIADKIIHGAGIHSIPR